MTPEQIEIERRAFEAWASGRGWKLWRSVVDGRYTAYSYVRVGWDAWLARAEQAQRVREALAELIRYVERNECQHEETYRGGAIWTICKDCDRKWADDKGGFKPYKAPKELRAARTALKATP